MSLCKALRPSSARPSQHRIISPFSLNRRCFADRHGHGSPSRPHTVQGKSNSDEQLSSDRDDVFKINPENKTVETAVGDLPLSPVMDPTFWEATRRHQVPKAKPGKPQNSVERQIRANPFAKALATPVRMCAVTKTRLPNFFLQDFNLVTHPETEAPWLIPGSLMADQPSTAQEPLGAESLEDTEFEAHDSKDSESTAATSEDNERLHGRGAYVLARQDLLSSFTVKKSGFDSAPKQITSANFRQKSLAGKVVWREDMDTYILDRMRQAIVDDLLYISGLVAGAGRYYIVKCYGWGDVQYKHKGAVLWFGEPDEDDEGGASSSDRTSSSSNSSNKPGPFATFDIQKNDIQGEAMTTTVAVHNMSMLLGPERAGLLKKQAAVLKGGNLFMLAGRRTTDLQLRLWKLQGYISDYREI